MMDPYPQWVADLVQKDQVREDDFFGLSVKTVTGDWRRITQGMWIVYQENGMLWEMGNDTFTELFYEVPQ